MGGAEGAPGAVEVTPAGQDDRRLGDEIGAADHCQIEDRRPARVLRQGGFGGRLGAGAVAVRLAQHQFKDAGDPWAVRELDADIILGERLSDAKGSNPGGLFLGTDGVERYYKRYEDPTQAYCEAVANRAYRELNIDAPESVLVRRGGDVIGVASAIIDNSGTLQARKRFTKGRANEVLRGYSADVWLANWDAVGTGLDNVVATKHGRAAIARIDQGGALLFRARAGRKRAEQLEKITEWDGFAPGGVNPSYADVFARAGVADADALGRKALKQIAAIQELGKRTDDFALLVPAARGVPKADRDAVLSMLRARARLLDTEIAPRVRNAMAEARKRAKGLPAYQAAYQKELGRRYNEFLLNANGKIDARRLGMTDPEIVALTSYTGGGYHQLNKSLRSWASAERDSVRNQKLTLQDALSRINDERGVFRRGTDLTEAQRKPYVVGKVIPAPAFTSASAGDGFGGNTRFIIHGRRGKNVVRYSQYPKEDERLFTADTRFKVLAREEREGKVWIKLEEVE